LEAAETEPLRVTRENALSLARAASAQEHWDDALRNFGEARAAQAEINQKYPGTQYANPAGLAEIEGEIASLQAAGLAATTSAREREGDAAAVAGRSQEAAASYAAAIEFQRQVNEKFPRSRFASPARSAELNAKRDTVLSAALMARARILDGEIAVALARRQTVAAREKISEATALVTKAAADFPRSRDLDRVLPARLGFLSALGADLDALQRECYERLAAVPGSSGVQMLKTEVTQDLYGRVMNANPSRNAGRSLPVDSVSWLDVREFCQRLSWALGVRVRPPSEAEIRAAFVPLKEVWSAETSAGHSHEVGKFPATPGGFHDLAGNLAEWLQSTDEASGTAPVAGGSYLDSGRTLGALQFVPTEKTERARHIGFRIVVERAPR
jgi:tetratricopeptide (TPR) repeat protein